MHALCGKQPIVLRSTEDIHSRLTDNSEELRQHISAVLGSADEAKVNEQIESLKGAVGTALKNIQSEPTHGDAHYVSRFDAAGLFQSALSKIFNNIPDLQGYGDKNPAWVTTLFEEFAHGVGFFFGKVRQDVSGRSMPLWKALVTELMQLPHDAFKAPFPAGIPVTQTLPENIPIVLLGDWGGDNDAAKKVASVVLKHQSGMRIPFIGIHLGDVYYGGTKEECEAFLRIWPIREDLENQLSPPRKGASWALNGNHEMYSGGEYYFDVILPAFDQPQSFFCLENEHWRLIGLDTAYANGSLKPASPDDPLTVQWNWLVGLLKDGSGKANILLTHHQPVSAHAAEWNDSSILRREIEEILAMEGIGGDAIFGWFFGHEHRCALYRDAVTPYNARLIGNGCIPHLVQTEKAADEGCTPVDFFNKRAIPGDSNVAVSMFAELTFSGQFLHISYVDEDNHAWGDEQWDCQAGRLNGTRFTEYDDIKQ